MPQWPFQTLKRAAGRRSTYILYLTPKTHLYMTQFTALNMPKGPLVLVEGPFRNGPRKQKSLDQELDCATQRDASGLVMNPVDSGTRAGTRATNDLLSTLGRLEPPPPTRQGRERYGHLHGLPAIGCIVKEGRFRCSAGWRGGPLALTSHSSGEGVGGGGPDGVRCVVEGQRGVSGERSASQDE